MTDKKANIIASALELFAEEGYSNTSTAKVARKALVSEGLIFRHFENKEGLLKAVMQDGKQQAAVLFNSIISENDPIELLKKTIYLALDMSANKEKAAYWKLQYKLKWELGHTNPEKMEPIKRALTNAFEQLDYTFPSNEADFLLIYLDGLAAKLFLEEAFDVSPQLVYLHHKYKLD